MANHTLKEFGKCFKCDEMIYQYVDLSGEPENIKEAGHVRFSFGYGSPKHDQLEYRGHICDNCMEILRESEAIPEYRNYFRDGDYIDTDGTEQWRPISELNRTIKSGRARNRRRKRSS